MKYICGMSRKFCKSTWVILINHSGYEHNEDTTGVRLFSKEVTRECFLLGSSDLSRPKIS